MDVVTIQDKEFIHNFLRFSGQDYENKLINFASGYSITNLFPQQQSQYFNFIKSSLFVSLTSQPLLLFDSQSTQLATNLINWLEDVTSGKSFEYSNKISNKQHPEDNILWFNTSSFHPLSAWLANQIQKSITKNYFKKDLLPTYKLRDLTEYINSKYPQHSRVLKLSIQEARTLSIEEIQNYSQIIKGYENTYFENIRLNFIQSLETLHNERKKKKNKRKTKKKNPSNPHNPNIQAQQSPHKHLKLQKQQESDQDQLLQAPSQESEQKKQQNQIKQSVIEEKIIEQKIKINLFEHDKDDGKTHIIISQEKTLNRKPKYNQQTSTHMTKCDSGDEIQAQTKNTNKSKKNNQNSKNLVMNKERSQSPQSKTKKIDNECSKSHFSGQIYETLTQAVQQNKNKREQFELYNFSEQNNDGNQKENQVKRQRRKKKSNGNRILQDIAKNCCKELVNRQLTNFIDTLSIQTNNLYESKVISFERVRFFIKKLYPQTEAILFGSNSMGLSLPSSDVDIMLYKVPRDKHSIQEILAQIAVQINTMSWIVSCSTYLNAKVPLVKLQIDPLVSYLETKRRCDYQHYFNPSLLYYLDIKDRKKAKNIYVDITINIDNNEYGHSLSTELMRSWVNANSILQRMILVFKYILAEKSYNKNFNGGLGSYCLFIMIAAYFKEFASSMPQDQGQIFLDILSFYGEEFQNKIKSITLRQHQSCFLSLEELLNMPNFSESILSNPLRIIDPLTQKLTSSSCSQYYLIKNEFKRIKQELLSEITKIQNEIILNFNCLQGNKAEVTQKAIEKFIHKYEVKNKFSIKKVIDGTLHPL